MSDNPTATTPDFESMDIGKLRQYASHLRVAVPKTATKVDIIEAISAKLQNRSTAQLAIADGAVPPGYAKIRVLGNPMPGASNYPIYVNANGYECTIPRDVDVIVPMRIVRTLNDAVVKKKKQSISTDASGRERFQTTENYVPSYPFQVLEMNPGPEVLTTLEQRKLKTIGPRRKYRDLFGRWPRPRDLIRAIEQNLITLGDDEELDAATASLPPTRDMIV